MVEVYDIETYLEGFCYVGLNVEDKKISKFIIHKDLDQLEDLITHIKSLKGMIGFNNLGFDYPVLHDLLNLHKNNVLSPNIENRINGIFQKAQSIIEEQNNKSFGFEKFTSIRDKDILVPQLDLFKLWHFNNKARMTSLKSLEISMNYPNVQEMPIPFNKQNLTLNEMNLVADYCLNDVKATYEFYLKSKDKIELRKQLSKKYNIPCINWNNGKIGENLLLKLYCEKTNKNYWETRKLRTKRDSISLGDCIPTNISFSSKEFNSLLDFYRNKTIIETKDSVDYSLVYKGIKYYYGTGGIHASIKAGIYESDDKYIIKSLDVSSLYPNLPIVYKFYPEHLGEEFLDVYEHEIVNVRLAEKAKGKNGDKAIIDGFKEAANIPYGKSNEKFSYLYDPLYSMKTTIAGQLCLSMLCESLSKIPDSQMLMVNTDGCEIKILREHGDTYNTICKSWEFHTKLTLEFADYQRMWIRDINNYGCITTNNKIKNKGVFEVDKVIGGEPAYHKDNSFRIIPLALQEYYTKNISIEITIRNHTNIYDFCGRAKFKSDSYGETRVLAKDSFNIPIISRNKEQKNTRYYISNKGVDFFKVYPEKKKEEVIHYGYKVVIFNKYLDLKNYNINYNFYIKETQKIIDIVEDKQLNLF